MPTSKQVPELRTIRKLLERTFATDDEFNAFLIDYFPRVKKLIPSEMNYLKKINLLLEYESAESIAKYLVLDYPQICADLDRDSDDCNDETAAPARQWRSDASQTSSPSVQGDALRASVWLDMLRTFRGRAQLAVAAIGVLAAAWMLRSASFARQHLGVVVVLLGLAASALSMFARSIVRRKRVGSVSVVQFVGPQPMTRADRMRRGFHGRDEEIERMLGKLAEPDIRHLILLGESGCGKTSLILAGVIPSIEQSDNFHPIYLRFSDHPVQALRHALRAECENDDREEQSLLELLRQVRARVQKTVVLFIDQFEEFHVNPIEEEEYHTVQQLIWAILGSAPSVDAKVVFCLRYDFLHLMDVFYADRSPHFSRRGIDHSYQSSAKSSRHCGWSRSS